MRATSLSAARAGVGAMWAGALMAIALGVDHPLLLALLIGAVCTAGVRAGCSREIVKSARFALPMALAVALLNALIARDGVDVVARLGTLPWLGRLDVTLESLVWGGVMGLRIVAVMAIAVLFAASVDQDALLGLVRRRAGRFGIATVVAGRLMPLMVADGRRMSEAMGSLAGDGVPRLQLLGAVAGTAMDRASDAAAALELRGGGDGLKRPRQSRRPWSRHDFALAGSAAAASAAALAAALLGWFGFRSGATLDAALSPATVCSAVLIATVVVLPFTAVKGLER